MHVVFLASSVLVFVILWLCVSSRLKHAPWHHPLVSQILLPGTVYVVVEFTGQFYVQIEGLHGSITVFCPKVHSKCLIFCMWLSIQ